MKNLAEFTYKEVRKYLSQNKSLIIPIGTCEQHGMHLPLETDTIIAEFYTKKISSKFKILAAPTVNYGVNLPCDMQFPGTTSLAPETLKRVAEEIINWWYLQGFKNLFFFTAHGDPHHLKMLKRVAQTRKGAQVIDIWDVDLSGILEKQTAPQHACEAETSLMLYLYPDKVRRAEIQDFSIPFKELKPYLYHKKTNAIPSCPGNIGFSTASSRRKGYLIHRRIIEKLFLYFSESV
ncbi:MAG: creatininase family protein [bacterium]|nr:creatininase family protein [bacterium]